jgi:hypothetical protein
MLPVVLLTLGLAGGGVLLLMLSRDLTYFQDTWSFLMNRRELTPDALLLPHNEHIAVIPVALEQLLLALFGMDSAQPEYVVLILTILVTVGVVFVYVDSRVGPWAALIAAGILISFGPAWQDLLWPFEICFVGSILFGVAMLLALEQGSDHGDVIACACLVASIGFSSLGLAFIAAAAVCLWQQRRQRGLRRAYVVLIPAALFVAWWIGWGHLAERHLSLGNALAAPKYMAQSAAAVVESVLGLSRSTAAVARPPRLAFDILVTILVLVLCVRLLKRRLRPAPTFWPIAAATITNWGLAALNYTPGREPYQSRYLFAGAVFVLLLTAELLRGVSLPRRVLIPVAAVALAAAVPNLSLLKEGHGWLENQTVLTRADLAAIEIARETVAPTFALSPEIAGTGSLIDIQAQKYLAAVDERGSPAYTNEELNDAPSVGRRQADLVLYFALPISAAVGQPEPGSPGRCVITTGPIDIALLPGTTTVRASKRSPADLALRRFATEDYPIGLPQTPAGQMMTIDIPADARSKRWHLHVQTEDDARVCASRA